MSDERDEQMQEPVVFEADQTPPGTAWGEPNISINSEDG